MKPFGILLVLFLPLRLFAQTEIDSTLTDSAELAEKSAHLLEFTTHYTNKVVFRGRDFGLKQWGLTQDIRYRNPTGWYASANAYYWDGVQSNPAKVDLSLGYSLELSKTVSLDFSYERWFFSNDTFLDPDALKNMAAVDLNYSPKNWEFDFSTYYMWGEDKALLLDASISRNQDLYAWNDYTGLSMGPKILIEGFAGDNLAYYRINKKTNKEKPVFVQQNMALANIELSLPLVFQRNKWELTTELHWAKPFAISEEDPPLSPYLKSGFFYFTASLQYSLFWKKRTN